MIFASVGPQFLIFACDSGVAHNVQEVDLTSDSSLFLDTKPLSTHWRRDPTSVRYSGKADTYQRKLSRANFAEGKPNANVINDLFGSGIITSPR